MSDLVQKKVEWVKAVGTAGGKSVDALLQQARPPGWKFWVGDVQRAAAVYVLAAKAKTDDRLLPCFFEVLRKDSSPMVRQAVVKLLLELSASRAAGSQERKSVASVLLESLGASQTQDVAIDVIRALGILGECKQDAVAAIRAFGSFHMKDPSKVEPRLLIWSGFALGALSDDPSGPLEALRKFIEEDLSAAIRKAASQAPEIELAEPDQVGLIVSLMHAADYELVSEAAIDFVVPNNLKVTKKIVAAEATKVARRIVEALTAAALLGPTARPLRDSIQNLLDSNPPKKMRAAAEQALKAIDSAPS